MVGTGQANIEPGLANEGELLFRMTTVADVTGHLVLNIVLTAEVRQVLYAWLDVEDDT